MPPPLGSPSSQERRNLIEDDRTEPQQDADDPLEHGDRRPPPVIGIGASAGGIEALKRLLPLLEPDCGMAFVVVLHLDPQHTSILPEMLARVSRLPVLQIEHGMTLAANTIYVIPSNVTLTVVKRTLLLAKPLPARGHRTTVDSFFVSLAQDQGDDAACIILSGTGSDGTLGLRAIKEHGGLTLAQAEAEYDGMMRSAVTTGMVDYVLPLEDIPEKLAEYFRHLTLVDARKGPDGVRLEAADSLAQIFTLLRAHTGHDFREYKDRTVIRRVQRRMQVLQISEVPEFVAHLRREPKELDLLFQDLLIGVTGFFRDPAAFAALERLVIPRLFDGKGPDDMVRVWVPACATGEEAYSIAILLRELAPKSHDAPKLQIFASDIDEQAVAAARLGRYPAAALKDIPPKRLERYFVREDGTWRVANELREICMFSVHSVLRDAPFSRLDLLSCRNLLIYLNAELQNRLIPLFHYALREDGFLFLGTSENVSRHARLFNAVDKANRLFQRRTLSERRLPDFPLFAPDAASQPRPAAARPATPEGGIRPAAERQVLDRHAPPFVIVSADGEVVQASARTGKFLELPAGVPDTGVLSLARRDIRPELRALLQRAIAGGQPAMQSNVLVATEGGRQAIDLIVEPLRDGLAQERLYMVVFKELGGVQKPEEEAPTPAASDEQGANLRRLEAELRAARERLQATTEELESANEELKSSNEELSSMNEEMQSANEELETSREELQSTNEELQTVNSELNSRVEELSRSNSDIVNLLESTQIATLFLDRDLCVKSFTPAAKEMFRLVDSDTSRPISHVRTRFQPDTLEADCARVLRTLATIERQVQTPDADGTYAVRIMPYRTVANVIDGVVITFTDISRISAAEARIGELAHDLRNRVESLETLLNLVPTGIFIIEDREGADVHVNRRGAQLLGEPEDQRGGMGSAAARLRLRVNGEEVPPEAHPLQVAARTGESADGFEAELLRADGSALAVMFSVTPLFNEAGRPRGAIAAVVDISERKTAEAHQRMLLHELQHRVKNVLATVAALATRMLKDHPPPDQFIEGFLARLRAMGRLHDLLSQHNWQGTDLRELLLATLAPLGGSERHAARLDGPAVLLDPGQSAAMGMVLHELATNAAKYGALSVAGGEVAVDWRIEGAAPGERVVLTWSESGGPPAAPPAREGFGTGFVRRSMQYELAGTFEVTFLATGLRAELAFPLQHNAPAATGRGIAT